MFPVEKREPYWGLPLCRVVHPLPGITLNLFFRLLQQKLRMELLVAIGLVKGALVLFVFLPVFLVILYSMVRLLFSSLVKAMPLAAAEDETESPDSLRR